MKAEVWLVVTEAGTYEVGTTPNDALERLDPDPTQGQRLVKLVVDVPLPTIVTLTGSVPAEGAGELVVS